MNKVMQVNIATTPEGTVVYFWREGQREYRRYTSKSHLPALLGLIAHRCGVGTMHFDSMYIAREGFSVVQFIVDDFKAYLIAQDKKNRELHKKWHDQIDKVQSRFAEIILTEHPEDWVADELREARHDLIVTMIEMRKE